MTDAIISLVAITVIVFSIQHLTRTYNKKIFYKIKPILFDKDGSFSIVLIIVVPLIIGLLVGFSLLPHPGRSPGGFSGVFY